MALDDYVDPEVGVAVAATALVFSPRARHVLHRSAVYGVAGALVATDAIAAFGRGIMRAGRPAASHAVGAASDAAHQGPSSSTPDRVPSGHASAPPGPGPADSSTTAVSTAAGATA